MREDIVFATDLDNTLIRSYKAKRGGDVCVERRDGEELSYMSREAVERLKALSNECLIVPVTTRSSEQYGRIDFGVDFKYAAVAHGAVLLVNGKPDEAWGDEIKAAFPFVPPTVAPDGGVFDVRRVDDSFLCMKSHDAEAAAGYLGAKYPDFDVFAVRDKVYIFPKGFNKGEAVRRLRKLLSPRIIIGAGDSLLDIPLLDAVDIAVAPRGLSKKNYITIDPDTDFAAGLLETASLFTRPGARRGEIALDETPS